MTKPIKRVALLSVGLFLSAVALTGCLKDGDDTIVLPLPDGTIPESVVSREVQESLRENGFNINVGLTPETVDGKFVADTLLLDFASDNDMVRNVVDVEMTFSKQLKRGLIKYVEKQRTAAGGSMTSIYEDAYIIGTGKNFTVYCMQEDRGGETDGINYSVRVIKLISGTITSQGIKDCQYALVIDSVLVDDHGVISVPGPDSLRVHRIYHECDSMATKLQ